MGLFLQDFNCFGSQSLVVSLELLAISVVGHNKSIYGFILELKELITLVYFF